MKKTILTVLLTGSLLLCAIWAIGIHADSDYTMLSELTPVESVALPDTIRYNETSLNPGGNISVGGIDYEFGISLHPKADGPAYLVYNVDGLGYKTFFAIAGKDRSAGEEGILRIAKIATQVWVDGKLAAESGPMAYPQAFTYKVNIAGAKELKLVLTDGGDGYAYDLSSFAVALLSKKSPDEFTAPAGLLPDPTPTPTPEPTNPPDIATRDLMFLSDMTWADSKIYSDVNGGRPARDGNVADEYLWIGENFFEKGVCFHADQARVYLEVDLEDLGFRLFAAYAGIAESEKYATSMGTVRFYFLLDGKEVLKTDQIKSGMAPQLITLDIGKAKSLRIEVDNGGDGLSGDFAALGGAVFGRTTDLDALLAASGLVHQTPSSAPTAAPTAELTNEPTAVSSARPTDAPKQENGFPVLPAVIGVAAVALAVVLVLVAIRKRKK